MSSSHTSPCHHHAFAIFTLVFTLIIAVLNQYLRGGYRDGDSKASYNEGLRRDYIITMFCFHCSVSSKNKPPLSLGRAAADGRRQQRRRRRQPSVRLARAAVGDAGVSGPGVPPAPAPAPRGVRFPPGRHHVGPEALSLSRLDVRRVRGHVVGEALRHPRL